MRYTRARRAPLLLAAFLAACTSSRAPSEAPKTPEGATSSGAAAGSPREPRGPLATAASAPPAVTSDTAPARDTAPPSGATAPPTSSAEIPVADEPLYFPGARPKLKGSAVEASIDDEIVATWNRGGLGTDADVGPKGKPLHAAPRVKVDVTEVRGAASEVDVLRAARLKSYWPFRICYEQGLRRTQKLHGTIKLRLTLGPSGRPSNVQQVATELGDADVVSCVVKSAMGLGLPAPLSGAPQVTLDISLWPGDAPVSVKSALHGKNAVPPDVSVLTDALRARSNEVRACYADGLRRHEKLWGRLALSLEIASGAVREASEIESHFPDAEVTECVRKVFVGAAMPKAEGDVVIVYPLRLGRAPDATGARR